VGCPRRSPQNRSLSAKVRAKGVKPRIDEHTAIVDALRRRDPMLPAGNA